MKYIYVSTPRTATKALAKFFQLYGVDSVHQSRPLPFNHFRLNFDTLLHYDLNNIPSSICDFVKNKKYHDFEACWELFYFMYACSFFNEETQFLVGIRDPYYVCNSYRSFRMIWHSDQEKRPLEYWARVYKTTYEFIIEQSEKMIIKPRWLDFTKLVSGEYTEKLFGLHNIEPSEENFIKAQNFFRNPVNSRGMYKEEDSESFKECRQVIEELKGLCHEL